MSQMLKAAALLDAIMQDCIAAWGLTDRTVHFAEPRKPQTVVPYVIIDMLPVPMGALAAQTIYQNYVFRIRYRDNLPASGNILLLKITKANLLIDEMITGPTYNDLAYLPYITEFDPTEEDDPSSDSYEFTLTFSCQVEEDHH